MAEGQRYYWYAPPAASDLQPFPLVLWLLSITHLDPVNTNYVQLFDNAGPIAPATVPIFEFPVFPMGHGMYAPAQDGRKFSSGLAVYLSSTPGFLTVVGGNLMTVSGEGRRP